MAIGALLGLAGSVLGGLFGRSSAKDSAESANQFTREQLQNRHQWEVADLKKAGLNPILSSGGTPSIGGSAQAQTPDFGANANSAIQSIANRKVQRESLDIQRSEAESRINLNSATAEKELANAELARHQVSSGYYTSQTTHNLASADQARANIKFLEAQGIRVSAETKTLLKKLEVSNAEIKHLEALVAQARSSSARNFAEVRLFRAKENSQGFQDSLTDALRQESVVRRAGHELGGVSSVIGTNAATGMFNSAVGLRERFFGR